MPTILFLCVHNAGRSQMAAGWAEHLAGGRVRVLSGGSHPGDRINPVVVDAMAEVGIDLTGRTPKGWTKDDLGMADVVVTMGCGDECPVIPGKRYEDWELADPHGRDLEFVRVVRDEIQGRVRTLLSSVGVDVRPAGSGRP